MAVIVLLSASLAIVVAALTLTARLRPRGAVASTLAFGLVAWGLCVGTVGVSGVVLRSLSPLTLLGVAAACAAVSLISARSGGRLNLRSRVAGGLAAGREALAWPPAAAAAVLLGAALLWRAVLAVRLPVVDILGWQYHLVLVDVWLQADALVRVPQNVWTDGWPATGELLIAWFAAFTRSDALAGMSTLLPIPVAAVACTGLARTLGAGRGVALLAGLGFGMTPAMIALAGTSYPDVGFIAAVLASWWLALRIVLGERDASAAFLFGIAAGLAYGTKATAFVVVTPAVAAVCAVHVAEAVARLRSRVGRRGSATAVALLVAPLAALGLAWYGRNLLVHGNPLFPVAIGPFPGLERGSYGVPPVPSELAGLGTLAQVLRSWAADWGRSEYIYNVSPGGFGHAWVPVVGLAVVGAVGLARRRPAWISAAFAALVLIPALVGVLVLSSPWYARYTLFVVGLGWALAAIALQAIGSRARTGLAVAVLALASTSLLLANVYPNVFIASLPSGGPERALAYLSLVLSGSEADRSTIHLRDRCAGSAVIPDGSTVLVAEGYFLPHAVVGPNLERTLAQPPVPGAMPWSALLDRMRESGAGWLVTRRLTLLDELVASRPESFALRGRLCHGGRIWQLAAG
jgi:hypothetical protein